MKRDQGPVTGNRGRIFVVLLATIILLIPTAGFAQEVTADEQALISGSRWPHCTAHNVSYVNGDTYRCGEKSPTEILAQSEEFGPFLCGVCRVCMDRGECTLVDTMVVVGNVGNFILGIVGSLALLTFVIGGVLILTSQGESGKVQRGRQFIFASAAGVAITLGAVLILRTLLNVVETGSPGTGDAGGVICDDTNDGTSCGEANICFEGTCQSRCALQAESSGLPYICTDPDQFTQPSIACITGLCPGDASNVCCNTSYLPSNPGPP